MSETLVRHPLFARFYSRLVAPSIERQGGEDLRRRVLDGLHGTVVEIGPGDGANFAHYHDEVTRIVAVEPEAYLREKAAAHADERVELRNAVATDLPLGDGEADAVVCTLVLCSVDQAAALAEARRVLRPGGVLELRDMPQAAQPPEPWADYDRDFDTRFNTEPFSYAFIHSDLGSYLEATFAAVSATTNPALTVWRCLA